MEDEEKMKVQDLTDEIEYAEAIINTVRHPLVVLDGDLRIVSVNDSFYKVFKVTAQETEKQLIYDLGNGQWNIPKLRELLEDILSHNSFFNDYRVEHDFQNIGQQVMMLNARRIPRPPAKPKVILLAIENITEISNMVVALKEKISDLETFVKAATGRELKMIDLEHTVDELKAEIIKFHSHL
jgi:PAS domain-containing protein